MKHLVIGLGEVGSAIQKVLNCDGLDFEKESTANGGPYDMLHICIPYGAAFIESVKNYIKLYQVKYVVVHSTVPLGTCDPEGWVHSPVRGIHPNLEEGIRTFTKYFGGIKAAEVAQVFIDLGIESVITTQAATTEALKLWDTTQYGVMIALEKEIHAYCDRHGLDFSIVYKDANRTYNDGYTKLGKGNVVRPYLQHMDGPIGGHCVIPNATILNNSEPLENPLVQKLLVLNEELENSAQSE